MKPKRRKILKGIAVGPGVVARYKFRDSLRRIKSELKLTLILGRADGISIEEMSKAIGIAAVVDKMLEGMPTNVLRGSRVYAR